MAVNLCLSWIPNTSEKIQSRKSLILRREMLIILYCTIHFSFRVDAYEYNRHNRRRLRIRNFVDSFYYRECYSLPHFLLAISLCLGRSLHFFAGGAGFDRRNSPVVFLALLGLQDFSVFRASEISLLSSFHAQRRFALASRGPWIFRIFQNAGLEWSSASPSGLIPRFKTSR